MNNFVQPFAKTPSSGKEIQAVFLPRLRRHHRRRDERQHFPVLAVHHLEGGRAVPAGERIYRI